MKHSKFTILIFAVLFSIIPASFAQSTSTQGTEFWVSFMTNGHKYHTEAPYGGDWILTQVLVSGQRDCSVTVTNPQTGWTETHQVQANNITTIDIDEDIAYIDGTSEQVMNKGLQITSTDTVSVFCTNIAHLSFDASYVLPSQSLADDYIIQTFDQSSGTYDPTSAFVIVATEDNTVIDITPSVTTLGGKPAHQEFTITLNRGQAYQLRSKTNFGDRDLSGTRVTARDCKRIAIFNGNNLTLVPTSASSDSDCVFEQAMPLHSWGKKFVVTNSLNRIDDYVKITSAADGNVILKNGTVLRTLDANESYTFRLSGNDKSCYLEASHSCAVYLYNSSSNGSGNGAPSMVWIAPIEQRIDEITFSTFNYDHNNVNINKHYVNIIVQSQDIGQVYLDNTLLPSNQFETVAGNDQYSFFRKQITHGVHHLSCPNGFNAHVYGFGDSRGYAYMVGSKASDLSSTIVVNNVTINPNDTVTNCTLDPVSFYADINLSHYEFLWEFGDGTTSTDNPVVHDYAENTLFEANLIITTEEDPCNGSSSSTSFMFYIDARTEPDTTITDLVCFKGPTFYTENGFNLYYDAPGTYTDTRIETNEIGCERQINLNLVVDNVTYGDTLVDTGHCNHFEWYGNTYDASGFYSDTIPNDDGCYSIVYLDLELGITPNPSEIFPADTTNTAPHWVVTATEFQIFSYDFTLWNNNDASYWDSIHWEFENPNIHWVILPDSTTQPIGLNCKIYVMEHVNDTVWLKATVYNTCSPYGVERRYWLLSSFYGIEEDDPSTGSRTFDVDIVPNPNNGSMSLVFTNMEGNVDAKVYDMTGILIDHFALNLDVESRHPYYLGDYPNGVYLLVFNYKGITFTKKIVVIE